MRLRNNLLSLIAGALALVGLTGQAQALGIPVSLSTLVVPGATLVSEDGNFTFSDFAASVTGAISHDLNDYNVQTINSADGPGLGQGFRLTGPFIVADGNVGDMVLSYKVTATPGVAITDAHLYFNGSFNGNNVPPGLAVSVNEDLFSNNQVIGQLSVSKSSGGFGNPTDDVLFSGTSSITVLKDIGLTSYGGTGGSVAHISVVDQTFTVPEPGTLLLGGSGLLGIALLGRKRVR